MALTAVEAPKLNLNFFVYTALVNLGLQSLRIIKPPVLNLVSLSLVAWLGLSAVNPSLAASSTTKLTVLTYSSFAGEWGPGPKLQQAFNAQCNCQLEFISVKGAASLLNHLRLAGKSAPVDLVLGLDTALMAEAQHLGLVSPHDLDLTSLQLKPELNWQDAYFVPFDLGYFAFIYRSDLIQPARSMAELLNSQASIIYADPRTSTPGLGLLTWMQAIYGNQAAKAWQQLSQLTRTITASSSQAYSLFLQGEADYVLGYTTSPAYHLLSENNPNFAAAQFSEGHIQQVEVVALSSRSQQPELARSFIQFLLQPPQQEVLALHNWMLPARQGVDLPSVFNQLQQPKVLGFSPETLRLERQNWLRLWRTAVSR